MRMTVAMLGLTVLIAGAATASAQTSLTASLPDMRGGVGITPHGTGFSGTMGDPEYWVAGTDLPASEGHYPGPYGTMGAPSRLPAAYPYAPPPAMQYRPAMQYDLTYPAIR